MELKTDFQSPFPLRPLSKGDPNLADKLGPLHGLVGNWSSGKHPTTGLNVIAVPGPKDGVPGQPQFGSGFVLEVIPYTETLNFEPIAVTLNRGPFNADGSQDVQEVGAVLYDQVITSNCDSEFCKQRGFPAGTAIHAEKGMLLFISNFSGGYTICRMGTIPHGNSIMLLGNSKVATGAPGFPKLNSLPRAVNPLTQIPFDYQQPYNNEQHDLGLPVINPNQALADANKGKAIQSNVTLNIASNRGTGGILNIPFISDHVDVPLMTADYWINTLADGTIELQYSQTMDLVFPPTGLPDVPVIWPHIDVNTLTKVD